MAGFYKYLFSCNVGETRIPAYCEYPEAKTLTCHAPLALQTGLQSVGLFCFYLSSDYILMEKSWHKMNENGDPQVGQRLSVP